MMKNLYLLLETKERNKSQTGNKMLMTITNQISFLLRNPSVISDDVTRFRA